MPLPHTVAHYAPHVDTDFTLSTGTPAARTLRLTSVKTYIDDEVQLCFSLLFLAEGDVLPQQLYPLSHAQLGELTLFLVPIRKQKAGILYEAVFNLLKDEDQ